ncbi:hypothetical protein NIES2100_76550 [Calothrix sp. NIES-2100]|nr:hypothetical protein NIES2100_76550 [Calothrix sp. NIES-2100]
MSDRTQHALCFKILEYQRLVNELPSLINGAKSLINELLSLINELPSLINGAKSLINELPSLINGAKSLINELPSLINGVQRLVNELPSLINGVQSLINELPSFINELPSLINGAKSLINELPSLINGAKSLIHELYQFEKRMQNMGRGTTMFIRVNLSQNAYSTGILPHPSIPAPNPQRGPRVPRLRGGDVLRQQNWGGVARILVVRDFVSNHILARVSR